jgi:hypothetical protein
MTIGIADFLPKYPELVPPDVAFANYAEEPFERAIIAKREFAELALDAAEAFPTRRGDYFKHQRYIARFLSSYTGYDELLLFHSMGTGKTCTTIAAIEKLREEPGSPYKRALILARGTGLLRNFLLELVDNCTDGRYLPEGYAQMEPERRVRATRALVGRYYEMRTFETFAKAIATMSDDAIRAAYNDRVIVFDEVQNLTDHDAREADPDARGVKAHKTTPTAGGGGGAGAGERSAGESVDVYAQLVRFCHVLTRRKLLALSGTPMADGPEEFATTMNLLLPLESAFPVGRAFLARYFDPTTHRFLPARRAEFAAKIRGRVSYLRAAESDMRRVFVGSLVAPLRHLRVVIDRMSAFQSDGYRAAYAADTRPGGKSGVYANARQAMLFVFPDGTWGSKGFEQARYVERRVTRGRLLASIAGASATAPRVTYALGVELRRALVAPDDDARIAKLARFSSEYAATIADILAAARRPPPRGKSFVYCQYVNGSGAILFSLLLTAFGFSAAVGNERTMAPRYALLTNETASPAQLLRLIQRYNAPNNADGAYIAVLIGSRVVNEGYTFNCTLRVHALTGHWNYTETAQAIARALRAGAMRLLRARYPDAHDFIVAISQRVPVTDDWTEGEEEEEERSDTTAPNIGLLMYEIAEGKDIIIKQIERVVKESAFDCALAKARNIAPSALLDGDRDCEYEACAYRCDGAAEESSSAAIGRQASAAKPISRQASAAKPIGDVSTYDLYYSMTRDVDAFIADRIAHGTRFVSFADLRARFGALDDFEIYQSIAKLIDDDVVYADQFGLPNFVRANERGAYATPDPRPRSAQPIGPQAKAAFVAYDDYYARNSIVVASSSLASYERVVDELYEASLPEKIAAIFVVGAPVAALVAELPPIVQRAILRAAIEAEHANVDVARPARALILLAFRGQYGDVNGRPTVWLHDDLFPPVCYNVAEADRGRWVDCTVDAAQKRAGRPNPRESPIGYSGVVNPTTDEFCILDATTAGGGAGLRVGSGTLRDLRRLRVGKICVDWDSARLVHIVSRLMKIDPPPADAAKANERTPENRRHWLRAYRQQLDQSTSGKNIAPFDYDDDAATIRILYWQTRQRPQLCAAMREWFEARDLIEASTTCGKQAGVKRKAFL